MSLESARSDNSYQPLSILVVRVSAIGDVLMSSPVAQALREEYPDAHISWIVEPLSAPIIQANPYVDEVIILETPRWENLLRKGKWITMLKRIFSLARELRNRKFDLVINVHGTAKSGIISSFTRAPRRIGPAPSIEGNHLFMTELTPWNIVPSYLSEIYLQVLIPLGIQPKQRRPILVVPEADRQSASAFLAQHGLTTENYVACCISSSWPNKDWVFSRWGELADILKERFGLRTVLIGGPERKEDARQLVAQYKSMPISAVGYLSLLESAAVIQGAEGVVGVDTGLTYAGLPADVPTVALYGPTKADWLSAEPNTTVILHQLPCAPCYRHPTCTRYDCMRAITVEEVAETLYAMLAV